MSGSDGARLGALDLTSLEETGDRTKSLVTSTTGAKRYFLAGVAHEMRLSTDDSNA